MATQPENVIAYSSGAANRMKSGVTRMIQGKVCPSITAARAAAAPESLADQFSSRAPSAGPTVRIRLPPAESRTSLQYLGCLILAIRCAFECFLHSYRYQAHERAVAAVASPVQLVCHDVKIPVRQPAIRGGGRGPPGRVARQADLIAAETDAHLCRHSPTGFFLRTGVRTTLRWREMDSNQKPAACTADRDRG